MKEDSPTPVHVWLVMMKAVQAITRYGLENLEESGLGLSDFAVLELLLHKGPLPVNVIGPKVNLTPGSISVAVERLVAKGLVSRAESPEDRRVRIVALTPRGKSVITPIFRAHAATMERVFGSLSREELRQLEELLKRIGRQAESQHYQSDAKGKCPHRNRWSDRAECVVASLTADHWGSTRRRAANQRAPSARSR